MSFLYPVWWWALAGLAVPLAIHLLSRGRRQRVAIGSIRHLAGSESRALRRLRLSGWRQLLIRMLLLAALAWALVGPRGPWPWRVRDAGTWVLIDPELAVQVGDPREADREFWERMEVAESRADTVRLLAPGLPELADGVPMDGGEDVWSLLREVDNIAPAESAFEIFTLDRVGWLRGRRPSLDRQIDWWVVAETQPNRWIQRSLGSHDGDWIVTVGESRAEGTLFDTYVWPINGTPPADANLEIDPRAGTLELDFVDRRPDDNSVGLPSSTDPIRVAMASASDRVDDAWHLERAVAAVGAHLRREVVWVEPGAGDTDLEIRLGTPDKVGRAATVILSDREVPSEPCEGRVETGWATAGSGVRLRQCPVDWGTPDGAPVWLDNWGRAVLTQRSVAPGAVFGLAGQLDLRTSDLLTSPALPHLLLELVAPESSSTGGAATLYSDRRATTGDERLSVLADTSDEPLSVPARGLETLAWLCVTLLLILERIYSGRLA